MTCAEPINYLLNIIYRRPLGLKMNGANAVLGTELKDSRPEIQRKASFNFQTRLLNKAGRLGWGKRGPIRKRNKGFFGEEILISIFTWC